MFIKLYFYIITFFKLFKFYYFNILNVSLAIIYIHIVKQLKSNTIIIYLICLYVYLKSKKLKEAEIAKKLCLTMQA